MRKSLILACQRLVGALDLWVLESQVCAVSPFFNLFDVWTRSGQFPGHGKPISILITCSFLEFPGFRFSQTKRSETCRQCHNVGLRYSQEAKKIAVRRMQITPSPSPSGCSRHPHGLAVQPGNRYLTPKRTGESVTHLRAVPDYSCQSQTRRIDGVMLNFVNLLANPDQLDLCQH